MPFGVRSNSRFVVIAALASFLVGPTVVQAGPADIAASRARQSKMRDMGSEFKAINDELKKRKPNWEIIKPNAESVASRSGFLVGWFPKGSGPEAGVKTYSLPVIWQQWDKFEKIGKTASADAAKLHQLASTNNLAAVKAQYVVLGKSCKACHDDFRSPDFEKDN